MIKDVDIFMVRKDKRAEFAKLKTPEERRAWFNASEIPGSRTPLSMRDMGFGTDAELRADARAKKAKAKRARRDADDDSPLPF